MATIFSGEMAGFGQFLAVHWPVNVDSRAEIVGKIDPAAAAGNALLNIPSMGEPYWFVQKVDPDIADWCDDLEARVDGLGEKYGSEVHHLGKVALGNRERTGEVSDEEMLLFLEGALAAVGSQARAQRV